MISIVHAAHDSEAQLDLPAEADTLALGAALAGVVRAGLHVWLQGDLGSGKTTLTRGLLRALGHEGKVKSPTYTLIEPYALSRLDLYHFDFYRFNAPEEYLDAGLDEYFAGDGVCIVEWPDKALPYLPAPDLELRLDRAGEGRRASITAHSEPGRTCVIELTSLLRQGRTTPPA
ncbi:tRNA (adenosine(37)-N6)-threonylcarbamoyltransferase complex ATPase subunit type 1 TsaE [Azoarcus olearius]|uniref:tRNA threonylcarbamoyladenosine biosynthesis protein TsaE n=1 Tax=Azoarcus sp. (strain BH72) TaxID=418699 RepID=A1K4V6_AZOSB|nr:tRNA (adenosine(37)-N6)-threonylcarbamoyltransferase complex ATPase subunit type 1 TsaE [Azoarcus olearius]ANQ84412.1 hypothetical protein dqs_1359 [Azoarcus olearius]CAL93861.1 conserved hypothetical protein [Azoarcus olearius]